MSHAAGALMKHRARPDTTPPAGAIARCRAGLLWKAGSLIRLSGCSVVRLEAAGILLPGAPLEKNVHQSETEHIKGSWSAICQT